MKICQKMHSASGLFLHGNRFGEMEHYITCSSMDALQWMGAVRMRVQTADKITIIHTTPVHQLMLCEEKSCVFVRNKSIIKTFFFTLTITSGQNTSPLYIMTLPPVKKSISCCLSHQNPPTYLFRAVLDCFLLGNGAWSEHIYLLRWLFFWTLILTAPIHCRRLIAEQVI